MSIWALLSISSISEEYYFGWANIHSNRETTSYRDLDGDKSIEQIDVSATIWRFTFAYKALLFLICDTNGLRIPVIFIKHYALKLI